MIVVARSRFAYGNRRRVGVMGEKVDVQVLQDDERVDAFTAFARRVEPRIRHALIATCGLEAAEEATAEALLHGWEHWERVAQMENAAGYLHRVARSRVSRAHRRKGGLSPVRTDRVPWVEPGLSKAFVRLSDRQQTVVWLVHGLGWCRAEVAEFLGLSAPSVQTHARRGMAKLRSALGGESWHWISSARCATPRET